MRANHYDLHVVVTAEQLEAPARANDYVRLTGFVKVSIAHADVNDGSACWRWVGTMSRETPMACMTEPAEGKARNMNARRAMWIAMTNDPLARSALILPSCRWVGCVNPAHLVKVRE